MIVKVNTTFRVAKIKRLIFKGDANVIPELKTDKHREGMIDVIINIETVYVNVILNK